MKEEEIRLQALTLALQYRANADHPETVLERAGLFESYIRGERTTPADDELLAGLSSLVPDTPLERKTPPRKAR